MVAGTEHFSFLERWGVQLDDGRSKKYGVSSSGEAGAALWRKTPLSMTPVSHGQSDGEGDPRKGNGGGEEG